MNLKKSLRALWRQGIEVWLEQGQLRFNAAKSSYTAISAGDDTNATLPVDTLPVNKSPVEQIKTLFSEHQTDILAILNDEPDLYRGFPLSQGQRSMVILQEMMPDSHACNCMGVLELGEDLDIALLRRSIAALIERHPPLRTEFCHLDGNQAQRVLENVPAPLTITTADNLNDSQIEAWVDAKGDIPFDLYDGANFVTHLLDNRNPDDKRNRFLFMVLGFHAISDFIGMEILTSDLAGIYGSLKAGEQPAPLSSDLTFKDYVFAESQALAGPRGDELWKYWQPRLANLPSPIELPTDFPRPPRQSYTGEEFAFVIDEILAVAIKKLSMKLRVTPFVVAMTAHQILMQRYSNDDRIAIGIPMAARSAYGCNTVVGHFTNPAPLIVDFSQNPQFSALVASNLDLLKGGMAHQEYPFQCMIDKLKPEHDLSRPTLFQTALTWNQTNHKRHNIGEGSILEDVRRSEQRGTLYDLVLGFYDTGKRIDCMINYNSDVFNEDRMARLSQHFLTLLRSIIANPELAVSELNILPPSERRLLASFNDTARPYPANHSVAELFENQVASTPDAIALDFNGDKITYAQLNDRANQVANQLQSMGINNGDFVGVCMERCNELLISILAIVKAGAAYVPMDVSYPDDRLGFVLEDTEARVVVSMLEHADRLAAIDLTIASPQILCLDRDANSIGKQTKTRQTSLLSNYARQTACVLFTSGSTGRPKGVMVPHNALSRLSLNVNFFERCPGDVIAHVNNISFDAASWEIWGTLLNGACLKIIEKDVLLNPQEFEKYLRSGEITALLTTTALFNLYATRDPAIYNNMKYVMLGGEALDPSIILQVKKAGGPQHLVNVYGPTENGTFSSTHDIQSLNNNAITVPIGVPNTNSTVYILDKYRNPAPIGVAGEIFVGGPAVALGYLKREDLTAEKFIKDPYTKAPDAMMYATGDIGRYRVDGVLEMVGRVDDQVKIRGFRIELGEIESTVGHHDTVKDCAVIAVQPEGDGPKAGKKFVAAYVVANIPPKDDSEKTALCDRLRNDMRQLLPDYMVPSAFVIMEDLPLTANGKINRAILPIPEKQTSSEYVAPRNELETQLTTLWSELLDVEKVGIYDDFFELGGHSLLATQLTSRIQDDLGFNISIRSIFEAPTCAALADNLSNCGESSSKLPPLTPMERPSTLPLSLAQQRLWFVEQLDPDNITYIMPAALRLFGEINIDSLERTFATIFERQESLRTRFVEAQHQATQELSIKTHSKLEQIDLSSFAKTDQELELKTITHHAATTAFDLTQGELFRFSLVKLSNTEHVLVLSMHHIISDGGSAEVLLSELGQVWQAYERGENHSLPKLAVQYTDYTLWQREWLQGEELERQLSYWRENLQGAVSLLPLPLDHPRPAKQSFRGASTKVALSEQLSNAIRTLGQQQNTSLFMTLIAAYSVLISRYTQEDDICIGFPISGRNVAELEPLVGLFVNNLVIRSDFSDNPNVQELLTKVRTTTLAAYDNQDVPFDLITDTLMLERSLSHTPLLQASFALQNHSFDSQLEQLFGRHVELEDIDWVTAKYDIIMTCDDSAESIRVQIDYATDLFESATIERLLSHFELLLTAMTKNSLQPVKQIPLITDIEKTQLLATTGEHWNATERVREPIAALQHLFERQVESRPTATAIQFENRTYNYKELNEKSNQLAHHLRRLNVDPDILVGVSMERSLEMSIALLAVLKAGGAYVPMDPSFPTDRLAFMASDSQIKVLLTQSHLQDKFTECNVEVLAIDADSEHWGDCPTTNPEIEIKASNLFNVIYTSGSTGQPKGVLVTHEGIINRLLWMQESYSLDASDTVLQKTPYSFDVSVWELFWPLIAGAKLVYAKPNGHKDPDYLRNCIQQNSVTTLHFVPSMLGLFLQTPGIDQCTSIKRVFCSGEALQLEHERLFFENFLTNGTELHNLYGPTEASVDVSYFQCQPNSNYRSVPIGKPVANTQLHILDEKLQPVAINMVGELYIGGVQLARGYLNQDELSRKAFIENPFHKLGHPSERLYKSGDLARYLPDGNIEYIGRADFQVKVRGLRIELGEIETVLHQHKDIKETITITKDLGAGNVIIVAYLVAQDPQQEPDQNSLRSYLKTKLPDYMVPNAFVFLESMPLSANGKVNRKALPEPEDFQQATTEYVAPRNQTEEDISAIWSEVLNTEKIGIHDNFFELGGHSLLATQAVSRIREKFDTELALRVIFETPTIAELALHLLETELDDIDLEGEDIESLLDGLLDDDLNDDDLDDLLSSGTE